MAVGRSIRRVAVETSKIKALHDFEQVEKVQYNTLTYVLHTFFIEDLKDYLDTWIIFYFNFKVNPQLCWGKRKAYSFAQSNKIPLKHDIIFKV